MNSDENVKSLHFCNAFKQEIFPFNGMIIITMSLFDVRPTNSDEEKFSHVKFNLSFSCWINIALPHHIVVHLQHFRYCTTIDILTVSLRALPLRGLCQNSYIKMIFSGLKSKIIAPPATLTSEMGRNLSSARSEVQMVRHITLLHYFL